MLGERNDLEVINHELLTQLKKAKQENTELQIKLDETIDDLIITQKNHNSAHDESLRFNQRLIEAEEVIEQLEVPYAVMWEALENIREYWNGDYNAKAMSDALDFIINRSNQALSQTAGRELLDKVKDLELSRDALCTVYNLEHDKVKRYEEVLRKVTNHSEWAIRGANRYGLVMGETVEKDFKEAREALEAKADE